MNLTSIKSNALIRKIFSPVILCRKRILRIKFNHLLKTDLKKYVCEQYKLGFKRYPDLDNPRTFNEKIQWLKLYWYDSLAEQRADKYAVRTFIRNTVGEKYLNEVYGIWNCVKDINFEKLPKEFVLKSTHASDQVIICKEKTSLNKKKALKEMQKWIKTDYYQITAEWVYKDIPRRIICERLIKSNNDYPPKDIKYFVLMAILNYYFVVLNEMGIA